MSYYKFISKQLVQTKNHLEARIYNQSSKQLLQSIEKNISRFEKELTQIILKVKSIISNNKGCWRYKCNCSYSFIY